MARSPLRVGCEKQLLFDDALTARKSGFTTTMNPAIRRPEPVLAPDQPWEIGGICGDSSASIIDDDGTYHLRFVGKGVKLYGFQFVAVAP
ncbi:MAG: hypothetical protein GXP25_06945 [Planctomycetes bacterium]|nr:hypothetical protein [Planctomycetota bacterium]